MIPEVLYDERGTFTKYKHKRHSRLRRLELLLFLPGLVMGLREWACPSIFDMMDPGPARHIEF